MHNCRQIPVRETFTSMYGSLMSVQLVRHASLRDPHMSSNVRRTHKVGHVLHHQTPDFGLSYEVCCNHAKWRWRKMLLKLLELPSLAYNRTNQSPRSRRLAAGAQLSAGFLQRLPSQPSILDVVVQIVASERTPFVSPETQITVPSRRLMQTPLSCKTSALQVATRGR